MMKPYSRYEPTRKVLIFWCLFIGIGAVAGAMGMLTAIDGSNLGMQGLLPYFQVLPFAELLFQDFLFPGIALLCVNGIPNLIAAALLLKRKKEGIICGGLFGVTLMLWICIQFVIFPANFMSTAYFFFGLAQALTGYLAWIFWRQESFAVSEKDYPHIGQNPKELVVYFSRLGFVKKKALEAADRLGAEVYQIQAAQRTEGTLGFWWCGRYGMHGWAMPIQPITVELEKYDRVTLCSPIWVFRLAAPMRSFCQSAKGRIKAADYVLVHHMHSPFENAAAEMDELLGLKHGQLTSICCHSGRYGKPYRSGNKAGKSMTPEA